MSNAWMIRAGEGGYILEDFQKGYAAVGWHEIGDLSSVKERGDVRVLYSKVFPDHGIGKAINASSVLYKFRSIVSKGDRVITYDPDAREYLVGVIASDYFFDPSLIVDHPHVRKVKWEKRISRDLLPVASRNSLGSTLTLFSIDEEVMNSIDSAISGEMLSSQEQFEEERAELEETREDTAAKAMELIKDLISRLDDSQLENLTAALLRSMGYQTRVTPKGPDRGVDVYASPDGLGFQEPRIKVEVKHRIKSPIGAQEIRSFIGALREGDRGLYVSTGGYTKEAKYEAERSKIPITLLDLDELVRTIIGHYEGFDTEGRSLLPLIRIYWPAAIP